MIGNYSFSEFFKNAYSLIVTKMTMPKARLIRRPIYIRGGKINGGKGLTTGRFCRIEMKKGAQTLFVGDNCEFGDNTHIVAYENVTIGNDVLIASKVFISDTSHGVYSGEVASSPYTTPNSRTLITKPVTIGNNVWLGENVVVLSGVTIGSGCVVGANSVVTKDLPENVIAVGSPARVIKKWDDIKKEWC